MKCRDPLLGMGEGLDAGAWWGDLVDADPEVFADFDGRAGGDGFVVDEQVERVVGGFVEFDEGARAQGEDVVEGHRASPDLDDDGDAELEQGGKFGGHGCGIGRSGAASTGGLFKRAASGVR